MEVLQEPSPYRLCPGLDLNKRRVEINATGIFQMQARSFSQEEWEYFILKFVDAKALLQKLTCSFCKHLFFIQKALMYPDQSRNKLIVIIYDRNYQHIYAY